MPRYCGDMILRFLSVSVLLSGLAFSLLPSFADDEISRDSLSSYETRLEEERQKLAALEEAAKAARTDLTKVNRQLIAAAQESLRREEQAAQIEHRLVVLQVDAQAARQQLLTDREHLKDILAALVSTTRSRPPALATHPDRATDAILAAIIMRDLADRLETRSEDIAEQIRVYADLTEAVQKEKTRLDAAEAALTEKEQEIQKLAAIKRAAYEDVSGETEDIKRRISALASRAENIRTLLAEIEANAPAAPSRKPSVLTAPARENPDSPIAVAVLKRLGLPAAGQIVQAYGDKLPTGRLAEGMTVRTRNAAQVVAPADGVIVFSGPFRSYGQMLILRTGDGYHIVLSGLADIYGARGQTVLAGEPVGQMSDRAERPSDLYMELRKDGTPEDPARWMSQNSG